MNNQTHSAGLRLTIRTGAEPGKTIELRAGELTIGRDDGCDFSIKDEKVSRQHAVLEVREDGKALLRDLRSRNGTYVNGHPVRSAILTGGEHLRFGDTVVLSSAAATVHGSRDEAWAAALAPTRLAAPVRIAMPAQMTPGPSRAERSRPVASSAPIPHAAPPATAEPSASAIQRVIIQRSLRRATFIGVAAIFAVVALGVLLATGILGTSETRTRTASVASVVESPAQVIAAVAPSTVLVVADDGAGAASRGSGWVWDAARGLIVTNAHVVAGGQLLTIGSGHSLTIQTDPQSRLVAGPAPRQATLLGEALCEDMAVLRVTDATGLKTLPRLSSQTQLQIGDQVIAVGYPATDTLFQSPGFGANLTGDVGVLSQPETTLPAIPGSHGVPTVGPYHDVILTDTAINPGNSGGPLVDSRGRLVGMNTAAAQGTQGQNYAIGIDRINEIVPALLAGANVCG